MLKFQRTKLVNIIKNDDRTVSVHGVLDDHIYEIEIDMTIGIDDLTIRAIAGKWIRAENSEWPKTRIQPCRAMSEVWQL